MKKIAFLIVSLFICVFFFAAPFVAAEHRVELNYVNVQIFEGDSLWDIARAYPHEGMSLQKYINQIKDLNGMQTDRIFAGRSLIIPTYTRAE